MAVAPAADARTFSRGAFWVCGSYWAFIPDPSTPPVTVVVVFGSPGGSDGAADTAHVQWVDWWVMQPKLTPAQGAAAPMEVPGRWSSNPP